MKGLFQNNYHILMADSTVKIFTDLKVGDKLKSWDVSKREFIETEIKSILEAAQSMPAKYVTNLDNKGFLLAKGFSIFEDGYNTYMSKDTSFANTNYGHTSAEWVSGVPCVVPIYNQEDNLPGLDILVDATDETSKAGYDFFNLELKSGENIFITPDPEKFEPFCLKI